MNYVVTIRPQNFDKAVLIINEELAKKLSISKKKRGFVSFGTQRYYVDVQISSNIGEGDIVLSESIVKQLHLPTYPTFEIKSKGNEIVLGPCIGILVSHKFEDITKRRLKEISINAMAYTRIHGAIIVFSLDKVDKEKRLIEGYCYNPDTGSWEKGIFPYPLAIFKRSTLNENWQNHFLSVIGDTVFSNHAFSKWDMYKWFSEEVDLAGYLPETKIYNDMEDFVSMLEKYKIIYAKPIWGMKGFGVIKVSKEKETVSFNYREDEQNKIVVANGPEELQSCLENLLESGDTILQQGLELIKYEGGIVDFRSVMQKNEANQWINNGIIARIGAKESVVSNISSGGAAMPALDLLRDALSASESEVFVLKEKMISLCVKVCKALDEYGFNFGMLGLDIAVDKDENLWIIEVNNRNPHPAIALRASDIQAYYSILTGPLHYAKFLAGFGSKEERSDVL